MIDIDKKLPPYGQMVFIAVQGSGRNPWKVTIGKLISTDIMGHKWVLADTRKQEATNEIKVEMWESIKYPKAELDAEEAPICAECRGPR